MERASRSREGKGQSWDQDLVVSNGINAIVFSINYKEWLFFPLVSHQLVCPLLKGLMGGERGSG
jgi:hypothetical protein